MKRLFNDFAADLYLKYGAKSVVYDEFKMDSWFLANQDHAIDIMHGELK